MPAPPKNAAVANSTRNSTGSRPKYSPRPPATPAPTRWVRLRRTRRTPVGSVGRRRRKKAAASAAAVRIGGRHGERECRFGGVPHIGIGPDSYPESARSGVHLMRIARPGRDHGVRDQHCGRQRGGPAIGVRRLYRRPDRGMLGGVAYGIAEHIGVRTRIVRICFVLLCTAGRTRAGALRRVLDRAAHAARSEARTVPELARVPHRRRHRAGSRSA